MPERRRVKACRTLRRASATENAPSYAWAQATIQRARAKAGFRNAPKLDQVSPSVDQVFNWCNGLLKPLRTPYQCAQWTKTSRCVHIGTWLTQRINDPRTQRMDDDLTTAGANEKPNRTQTKTRQRITFYAWSSTFLISLLVDGPSRWQK